MRHDGTGLSFSPTDLAAFSACAHRTLLDRLRGAAGSLRSYRGLVARQDIQDARVSEELHDLEAMAMSFDEQVLTDADVKYMKQRIYSAHRSRDSQKEGYRRGGG